jgi:SAM-dependent methyltransferase
MVELASAEAQDAGVSERLAVEIGDAHNLAFDSSAFDLVVALGVIPFLHAPQIALLELARVARPDGWILFNNDNSYRLNKVLDPRYCPFPGREALKDSLTRMGAKAPPQVPTRLFSFKGINRMIEQAGLRVQRCVTIGFGPFTFLDKPWLSEPRAIKVNDWLQTRADRGVPGLRSVGAQHLILARKA